MAIFQVRIGNKIHSFDKVEEIPEQFDRLITFCPDYPPPPHSNKDHLFIETLNRKLHELLEKEQNASSN